MNSRYFFLGGGGDFFLADQLADANEMFESLFLL